MGDAVASDVIARAREIAARLAAQKAAAATAAPPAPGDLQTSPAPAKRATDDGADGSASKRHAGLGYADGGSSGSGGVVPGSNPDAIVMQELVMANNNAGLLIGRGGENIRRLEQESGCRIQVTPDVGAPERRVHITGTKAQRERALRLIEEIIDRRGGGFAFVSIGGESAPGGGLGATASPGFGGGLSGSLSAALGSYAGRPTPSLTAISEHYMVAMSKVGPLIGRGGENIRDLERRSGAILQMTPESQAVNGKRVLVITGDEAQRTRAKVLIDEILSEDAVREIRVSLEPNVDILNRAGFRDIAMISQRMIRSSEDAQRESNSREGSAAIDYQQNTGGASPVFEHPERRRDREMREGYGPRSGDSAGGSSRADAPQDFFARELASFKEAVPGNSTSGRDSQPPPPPPPSDQSGSSETQPSYSAYQPPAQPTSGAVGQYTGGFSGGGGGDSGRAPFGRVNPNDPRIEIQVPGHAVGMLIGRGGENIRRLEQQYNFRFILPHESAGQPMRTGFIIGDVAAIQQGELVIKDIIQMAEGRAGGGGGGGRLAINPDKQIRIPAERVGTIIGRGGEMIKYLERTTGARIIMDQSMAGPERTVNVMGTPEQCAAVEQMIWAKIQEQVERDMVRSTGGRIDNLSSTRGMYEMGGATAAMSTMGGAYPVYADPYAAYQQYGAYAGYAMPGADGSAAAAGAAAGADGSAAAAGGAPSTNGTYDGNFFYANDYPGWRFNYTSQQWEAIPPGTTVPTSGGSGAPAAPSAS